MVTLRENSKVGFHPMVLSLAHAILQKTKSLSPPLRGPAHQSPVSNRRTAALLLQPTIMSKQSVFCIAHCRNLAELIVDQLKFYAISNRDISILYSDVETNRRKDHHFGEDWNNLPTGGARAGAGEAVIGGTLGWIMGIGALAVPGAGAFIAAGPIVTSLSAANAGATERRIAGGLTGLGVPESKAKHFEDRIRLGNLLISVHTESPAEAMQAKFIFTRARAQDICFVEPAFPGDVRRIASRVPPQPAPALLNYAF